MNARVGATPADGLPQEIDWITSRAVRFEDLGLPFFFQGWLRKVPFCFGVALIIQSCRAPCDFGEKCPWQDRPTGAYLKSSKTQVIPTSDE